MQKKNNNNKKEVKRVSAEPEICCPYFDEEHKSCSHPDCIRMLGFECKYSNRKK